MVIDLKVPQTFTIENKTNEIVSIRHYFVNAQERLQPGDSITVSPKSSEELAYYMEIQKDLETASKEDTKPSTPEDYIKIGINAINTELGHQYVFKEITSEADERFEFVVTRDGSDIEGKANFGNRDGQMIFIVTIHWSVARINQAGEVLSVEEQQN